MNKMKYPIGTKIKIKMKGDSVYNETVAIVASEPFTPDEASGYFVGFQRVKFSPPIHNGERLVVYDVIHPSHFEEII